MVGKNTPLYEEHEKLGGKIVEFGGWLLPVQYTSILAEHKAVRTAAGLFDVSHMGEVWVKGPDAMAFVQNLVTNDVADMIEGQVKYTPMCYPDGGTVDDILVYKFTAEKFYLVVNAANTDKDFAWMNQQLGKFSVTLENSSPSIGQLALQGPKALTILSKLTTAPIAELGYYHFLPEVQVAGIKAIVSRTGYTGEDGFEIYCPIADTPVLWEKVMKAGQEEGLLPCGLGARDTLRFECCMPLYGHELSDKISPLMAGIGFFVKLTKDSFVGKEALAKQKAQGLAQKVVGLELTGRGIARNGFSVKAHGQVVGKVTTGSVAPTLNKHMALALVDAAQAVVGTELAIDIRGKDVSAVVVKKPFYKRGQ